MDKLDTPQNIKADEYDWEGEFDKLWECEGHFDGTAEYDVDEVKSFISNLVLKTRKDTLEEVRKRAEKLGYASHAVSATELAKFVRLDDLLKALTELE